MADWDLNYSDRETLRPHLVPRIKQAFIKFMLYVAAGNGHSSDRQAWAKTNLANAQQYADQISTYVMSETGFIQGGTSISDAAIQSRTESVLTSYIMPA